MIGEENLIHRREFREPWEWPDESGEVKMQNLGTVLPQYPSHSRYSAPPGSPRVLDHFDADVGQLQIGAHGLRRLFEEAEDAQPAALTELNGQTARVGLGAAYAAGLDAKD